MRENRIIQMIDTYQAEFDPSNDMNIAEVMNLIEASHSQIELAENAYLYGHMRENYDSGLTRQIPLYNLRQMSDAEWAALSVRNKEARLSHN